MTKIEENEKEDDKSRQGPVSSFCSWQSSFQLFVSELVASRSSSWLLQHSPSHHPFLRPSLPSPLSLQFLKLLPFLGYVCFSDFPSLPPSLPPFVSSHPFSQKGGREGGREGGLGYTRSSPACTLQTHINQRRGGGREGGREGGLRYTPPSLACWV